MLGELIRRGGRVALGILILGMVMGLLGACNSLDSAPQEKSEYQKRNEAFVEQAAKGSEYKELKFLNHPEKIYYKELPKVEVQPQEYEYPFQNSEVRIELSGRRIDGIIFQPMELMNVTIYDQDAQGRESGIVEGLRYALLSMKVGDHWEVVVPYSLGYGQYQKGDIPAFSTLIFDVTLLKISKP